MVELTEFRRAVVAAATAEWQFFGYQQRDVNGQMIRRGHRETDEGYDKRIGTYWKQALGLNRDGDDTDWYWSAAFVSFVMKIAGAGDRFAYAATHSKYIHWAIRNRLDAIANVAFLAHRLHEYAPLPGDIIGRPRKGLSMSYDQAATQDRYAGHCDIVVAARPGILDAIGGNVDDSVTMTSRRTRDDGTLIGADKSWFVVIRTLL